MDKLTIPVKSNRVATSKYPKKIDRKFRPITRPWHYMKRNVCTVIASILTFALAGCLAPHVVLDKGVIRNETRHSISDVVVRHEPSGAMAQTNMILPFKSFDLGFSGEPMLGRQAVISWKEVDGQERRHELDLPYNRVLDPNANNMTLVYIIHSSGRVSVHLQDSEARR